MRNPENIPVQLHFAEGVVSVLQSCMHFKKQLEKTVETDALVQTLKQTIPQQLQNRPDIRSRISTAEALVVRAES